MIRAVRTLDARLWLPALGAALSLSGYGPLWMVGVWFVGFVAARSSARARLSGAALPFVLALAGSLAALPDRAAWVLSYAQLAAAGFAAHFALNLIEERRRRGLGLLALVWLCAPTPLGVAGLIAGGVALGLNTQRGARARDERRALWAVAGLALALTLGAALLPRPPAGALGGIFQNNPVSTQTARKDVAPPPAQAQAPSGGAASSGDSAGALPTLPAWANAVLNALPALLLGAMLVALMVFVALVLRVRARTRRGERAHWSDLIAPAALVIGLGMALAYSLLLNREGGGLGAAPSEGAAGAAGFGPGGPPGKGRQALAWGLFSFGVGTFALLIAGIIGGTLLMLRYRPRHQREASALADEVAPADAESARLHRVREAYRRVLEALLAAGLGRREDETPQELAARVGARQPEVRSDLLALTKLYELVRYGRGVTREHAERAELIAARLKAQLEAPSNQGEKA